MVACRLQWSSLCLFVLCCCDGGTIDVFGTHMLVHGRLRIFFCVYFLFVLTLTVETVDHVVCMCVCVYLKKKTSTAVLLVCLCD